MKKSIVFLATALLASSVSAKLYLMPSNTQLSGSSEWVTFDLAYADYIFIPIHSGGKLEIVKAISPSGEKVELQNGMEGKLRTVFDIELKEKGTYSVESLNQFYYVKFKKEGEEKLQKWKGSKAEFEEKIKDVKFAESVEQVRNYTMRADAFVTLGEPSDNGLKASDSGFDFDFVTNPTDYYVGEKAEWVLKKNGKPLADTEVDLERASARYLPARASKKLKSDKDGKISLTWEDAGRYVMSIEYKGEKPEDKLKPQLRLRYYATFEVLGEN